MHNTSRSFFKGCVFLAAVVGIGVSLYAEANINCNFESGSVEKWQKNSAETELAVTADNLSAACGRYALLASGAARNVGINYYAQIPVTDRTVIEFDIRWDAQMPLAYFAFMATDNKKRVFWLFAGTLNAIKNPKRGEWFHVIVPAAALKTDKGQQPEPGDVFTSFGMFQVQVNGCPHRFMVDNFKIYEKDGLLESVDPKCFMDKTEPGAQKKPPVERSSADALPLATVPGCGGPVIDGNLSDSCWQSAAGFALLPNYSGKTISENTQFLLSFDADNLYIGVVAGQRYLDPVLNLLDKAKCKVAKNDGPVYYDDSVEIFLMPSGDGCYQFVINSDGVMFDAKNKDASWNSKNVKIAVKKNDRTWTAEIAIPFKELGITASDHAASAWRANFYRNNPASDESSAWSPTQKSFHTPGAFGFLSFDAQAAAIRGESFVIAGGSAAMKLFCGKPVQQLSLTGAQSTASISEKKMYELTFKPDADGFGQIRISASDKEIFRTPSIAIKGKSSDCIVKLASDSSQMTVFVNGKQSASAKNILNATVTLDEDRNIIALCAENAVTPLTGSIIIANIEIPVNNFLFSETPAAGWEKNGFDDSSWMPYDGRVSKKLYLRYNLIRNHTMFAPQLENDTFYIANKAAMKLTFRISSPFEKPLENYRFNLEVPESINIPAYCPDLRRYNKYINSFGEEKRGGMNSFVFSFDKPVPKLAYNFGFNVITMIIQPDFPAALAGKIVIGRAWISGKGVAEIPMEFKIKVLPELNGRQPKTIPIATWASFRDICYATKEIETMPGTWRNAGFTMIGDEMNIASTFEATLDNATNFTSTLKRNNLKTALQSFVNDGNQYASESDKANPTSTLVRLSSVKSGWQKPLCPLYYMASRDIEERLMKITLNFDCVIDDMERGIGSSCLCPRCREYFAKENKLGDVPDEKTILAKYKPLWIRHQVLMNRKVFDYFVATARKAKPEIRSAVYSGYATTPPEQYGMDWRLYKDVDFLIAGYDENKATIMMTRNEMGGRKICPGLILDTGIGERTYVDQNMIARLWKLLIAGGFGGVHIWDWLELDGRGLHSIAKFSRGVAEFENILDEKNQIPFDGLIVAGRDCSDYVYNKGSEYLYVAINDSISPRTVKIKMPKGISVTAKVQEFSTGTQFTGKNEYDIVVPPNDVMLLLISE